VLSSLEASYNGASDGLSVMIACPVIDEALSIIAAKGALNAVTQ
jgi:hypothetical protein